MIPFTPITLLFIILSFIIGFLVGKKVENGRNQQNAVRFADLNQAREAGKKGRVAIQLRTEKRKARILKQAQDTGKITNDDVEDLFCISDTTARNYLNELEAEDKLIQVGASGRGVFYTPK